MEFDGKIFTVYGIYYAPGIEHLATIGKRVESLMRMEAK